MFMPISHTGQSGLSQPGISQKMKPTHAGHTAQLKHQASKLYVCGCVCLSMCDCAYVFLYINFCVYLLKHACVQKCVFVRELQRCEAVNMCSSKLTLSAPCQLVLGMFEMVTLCSPGAVVI